MESIRTCVMLFVLALTLSLAATAAAQPLSGPEFIPLATPCRVLDTREGQPIQANEPFPITIGGICGVPVTAVGAALNFTITGAQGAGHLAVWPSGSVPATSVVNFTPRRGCGQCRGYRARDGRDRPGAALRHHPSGRRYLRLLH